MSIVETRDGTRLYYNDWGSGPPVLLLNVAMMDSRMWEFQAGWLAQHGVRCITVDRRGCGRSDAPWDGYDYDTLSDDIADLLAYLDVRDVTLVGYAVGGGEAVRYLTRHGAERVAKLTLVSSTTPFQARTPDNPDGLDTEIFEQIAQFLTHDRPQWAESMIGPCFHGLHEAQPRFDLSPQQGRWMSTLALSATPRAAVEVFRTLFHTDQRAELPRISVPTLVIHGDADLGAPYKLCGIRSHELIPGSRMITYPDAAHGLFLTHRDQLNEDLLAWVKE